MELYEEVENTKKSKLTMIIGICIAVLIVLTILIICGIIYLNVAVMRITVDGQSKNAIEQILYIPENIPIRAIAKYLNYEDYRGDYKIKSEDSTKCYVKNENEIAMFTKDSDTLVKTRGDSDYEYIKIDKKVIEKDGELYTTPKGIEEAFNTLFDYNSEKKRINIYTMDYLNQYYSTKQKIDGEEIKLSEEYSDKKAIFENMMIIISNDQYGVINAETGESVLENKYEEHKKYIGNCYIATKYREKYPYIIAFKIIDVPDSSYQDRAVCITISSNNFPKCLSVTNEILSLWSHDGNCLIPTEGALQVIDKYRRISSEEVDDMLNEHFQKILTDKKI